MACPASGKITIQDLVNEFGGTAPHQITEYYRNGSLVPGNNTNVPESGQISLTQFYSAVNEILHTHSDGDTHVDLATIFGSNWASTVPKRVVVPSGVTVGGTSTHAMNVPSGMGGTLNIVVSGNIHGHGGAANGGNGGNAINCVQTTGVTITLNSGGTIKAGGGGGGAGGTGGTGGNGGAGGAGGQGRYMVTGSTVYVHDYYNTRMASLLTACNNNPPSNYANQVTGGHQVGTGYVHDQWAGYCQSWSYTSGGAGGAGGAGGSTGGAGGAGGVGQGYSQSTTSGSAGGNGSAGSTGASGSSGGTSAGTGGAGGTGGTGGNGGTGGAGGSFGTAGSDGNAGAQGGTGAQGNSGSNGNYANGAAGSAGAAGASGSSGSSGGAAGYYIYNRASITFNNSGTVAGQ